MGNDEPIVVLKTVGVNSFRLFCVCFSIPCEGKTDKSNKPLTIKNIISHTFFCCC